jgi:hypothetical protein
MTRTIGVAVAAAVAVSLTFSSTAFAAVGSFRYSHGEPLNDLRVTPGVTFHVTVATICRSGYSTSVRDVPESEKNQVYAEYGITHHTTGQYEIDHLISLELGGSNAIGNLWPELNDHPHGYLNSKDILENRLHALLCTGKVSLRSAQTLIASNWVTTYHRFLGAWPKANAVPPTATTTTAPVATTTSPVTTTTSGPGATTTTQVGAVKITSLISSVAPGAHESLTVHSSKPSDSCTLAVTLPSGRPSTESGLGATAANASGDATWTWLIGSTTGAGTAHVSVTCSAGSATGTFTIT